MLWQFLETCLGHVPDMFRKSFWVQKYVVFQTNNVWGIFGHHRWCLGRGQKINKKKFSKNPTSPLGDRWFSACVPVSCPPILQSFTMLKGGVVYPPPTSSPGSKTEGSFFAMVVQIRLFRHLGCHHFFIIFPTPFYIDFGSILDPNLDPKSLQNWI